MKKGNFTVEQALIELNQKRDVRINTKKFLIQILSDKVFNDKKKKYVANTKKRNDLGIKSWGKIAYLQQQNFRVEYVERFANQSWRKKR